MKIIMETYSKKITFEMDNDDLNAKEIKAAISRMLVLAGFSPDVIECEDGGHFVCQYVEED